MADLQTCNVRTAPTLATHVVRKQELDSRMSGLAFSQALTAGQDAVTLDYTALGLSSPPSAVRVVGISKTVSGQANLYASILEGWSATTASVELNAPCDVSGRKIQFLVIP